MKNRREKLTRKQWREKMHIHVFVYIYLQDFPALSLMTGCLERQF